MPVTPHFTLTDQELADFRARRHAVSVDDAIFRFEGTGALDCLQGLLTNDVKQPGDGSAVWGAVLTPKGAIISDLWVLRDTAGAWVLAPGRAHATMQQLFARTIPPRLARVADHTEQTRAIWLLGRPDAPLPGLTLFRPHAVAPFGAVALVARADGAAEDLAAHGWSTAPTRYADAAKLQLGWPTLGREIDERTLPQEVRFDELSAVKYDKGCYTGQETVARLHFRGHTNRVLRGIVWAPGDRPTDLDVGDGEKSVGTLCTIAAIGERYIALAMLRRTVGLGDTVRTGLSEGVVVEPPFDLAELIAA